MKTVQKLNYLEELIDEEYLDEKDESSLREGLYAGLLARPEWIRTPPITQQNSIKS